MMSQAGVFRKQIFAQLPNPIYLRMVGYALTLAIHCTTIVQMTHRYKGDLLKDPDVALFEKYHRRLLTVWNVFTQICYAAVGLSCDVLTLTRNKKHSGLLKILKSTREIIFSAVVFPVTMLVFSMFWGVLYYESTLVVPVGVAKAVLPMENFLVHTFIVPVVMWEIVCRPRKVPTSHVLNFAILVLYGSTYMAMLLATYYESSHLIYPILTKTFGTPYFFGLVVVCFIVIVTFYTIQWILTEILWGHHKQEAKKIKYKFV